MIDSADCFLDTNILIYASNGKFSEFGKYKISQGLLTSDFGVSGQTLAEFFANSTRKGKKPLSIPDARKWIDLLLQRPFVSVDQHIVQRGIENATRYQISYWDGAIIAAAERLGCKTLYSEDLNHNQTYGSLTVINPFL